MFKLTPLFPLTTRSTGQLSLRPVQPADQAFEQTLYASTRADLQMLGLPGPLLDTLLTQQQKAQELGMAMHYPQAQRWLVEETLDGIAQPLGRVLLCELAEPQIHLRILDLAVLPNVQRQGIAMAVLRAVQGSAKAAGMDVRLAVAHSNLGAQALYRKAGFVPQPLEASAEPDPLLLQMQWLQVATLEAQFANHS
jgi:ribosomal protein S18 acetylase RimI-like enzyme